MLLEGLSVDPAELPSVSVCWKCMVRARGVVSTTAQVLGWFLDINDD